MWNLKAPEGNTKEGAPKRGVVLEKLWGEKEENGPHRFKIAMPKAPLEKERLPTVTGWPHLKVTFKVGFKI